jgi:hypothetical protein
MELEKLTHRRRKVMEHIRRKDFPLFMRMIKDLGLKLA